MHDKNVYVWNDAIFSYVFGVYTGHIANIGFVRCPKKLLLIIHYIYKLYIVIRMNCHKDQLG